MDSGLVFKCLLPWYVKLTSLKLSGIWSVMHFLTILYTESILMNENRGSLILFK